jgi:hypothetical protein
LGKERKRKKKVDAEQLTPAEIADVTESKKEIAEGKCKTFDNAEDLIKDLHKDEPVIVELTPKSRLESIIASAPALPDINGKDFRTRLFADYEPQLNQFLSRLKEFAMQL